MGFDFDADVEVAGFAGLIGSGAAFAFEADAHAVVDAGGDFDFYIGAVVRGDGFSGAEDGFFEGKGDVGLIISTTLHSACSAIAENTT